MFDDELLFADEAELPAEPVTKPVDTWKILIVDDDEEVHSITTLVLKNFTFGGYGLQFLHAYNGQEAKEIIAAHPDTAIIFLDVVMEVEDAGLQVVRYIRNELQNHFVRIILRTGQPGQAPEEKIIVEYDINDYKEKTELSSQKLFTVMVSSLRTYQHLMTIDANRIGLQNIIEASASLFERRSLKQLSSGVLTQLVAILDGLRPNALVCQVSNLTGDLSLSKVEILAATGKYESLLDTVRASQLPTDIFKRISEVVRNKGSIFLDDHYIGYFRGGVGGGLVLYCEGWRQLNDMNKALMEIYCNNVQVAFENVLLNKEIEDSQKEIIFALGEFAEARSQETGTHVKRVSEICRIIGQGAQLTEEEVDVLQLASPMHDIGKVAIPDEILNYPGKLSADAFATMQDHTQIGSEMLASSPREIMKAAAIIAIQHHEKYDGSGYPKGLKGGEIHIFARIVALADVYDALSNDRVYRKAFEPETVLEYISNERGGHFDPQLVDIFTERFEEIKVVC